MLLFVRDPYARMLREGSKRWELRPDVSRYGRVRPGDAICVNGRERYRVAQVRHFPTAAAAAAKLGCRVCGFESADAAQAAWQGLYPDGPAVLALRMELVSAR